MGAACLGSEGRGCGTPRGTPALGTPGGQARHLPALCKAGVQAATLAPRGSVCGCRAEWAPRAARAGLPWGSQEVASQRRPHPVGGDWVQLRVAGGRAPVNSAVGTGRAFPGVRVRTALSLCLQRCAGHLPCSGLGPGLWRPRDWPSASALCSSPWREAGPRGHRPLAPPVRVWPPSSGVCTREAWLGSWSRRGEDRGAEGARVQASWLWAWGGPGVAGESGHGPAGSGVWLPSAPRRSRCGVPSPRGPGGRRFWRDADGSGGPPGVCARVLVGPLSPLAPLARPPGCDQPAHLLSGHILSSPITPHGSSLRIRHLPKVDV